MSESLPLKRISLEGIPQALEKAERYRVLNDPEQAESICLDILETDPQNQKAGVVLILALTDQFSRAGGGDLVRRARELLPKLTEEYARLYFAGIIHEREARAFLGRGASRAFAYDGFWTALEWYAKAQRIHPPGNDDAVLRWNSCVRTIEREGLSSRAPENELPLE